MTDALGKDVAADPVRAALAYWFGFPSFRTGQERVVRSVLSGCDTLVVMPTGSGKSLCFQLPALMLEGTTLVVSPLIALMKDQVDALCARRIPATFLNSSLTAEESAGRLSQLRMGHYKLVYVAPERFRNPRFLEALKETKIAMLAIDEAHCISSWGHDFRPDYLHLGDLIRGLPADVRILAVTATATDAVRRDIIEHLSLGKNGRGEPAVFVTGFARPNLSLNVTRVHSHAEKLERLLNVAEFFGTGIIYCATRKMVERVQSMLRENGVKALAYSGGLSDTERSSVQDAFMRRDAAIVVATNAFGMGVDRSDIRFVVHWDIPGSLEAYYQEVGRAGRDGAYAWCELLFSYADRRTQEFFNDSSTPPQGQVYELYSSVRNACAQGENGEACMSPEDWASLAGMKSALAVRNLIALFERHGLLNRTRYPGSPYSVITVPKAPPIAALKSICDGLAAKADADEARLNEMIAFANARGCRHRFLMAYFGEKTALRRCTKCDNCHPMNSFPVRLMPTEERLTDLRKLMSCIVRMHGEGNWTLLADVLKGTAPDRFKSLTTYGILPRAKTEDVIQTCEALEMDGYLLGMQLTRAGFDLVLGKSETVPLAVFHTGRSHALSASDMTLAPPPSTRDDSADTDMATNTIALPDDPDARYPMVRPRGKRRASAAPNISPDAGTGPAGGGLASALRRWVREEGERRALPTYCILKSQTIALIARRRPTSLDELALIPGLGPVKIAHYGNAIVDLVCEYE